MCLAITINSVNSLLTPCWCGILHVQQRFPTSGRFYFRCSKKQTTTRITVFRRLHQRPIFLHTTTLERRPSMWIHTAGAALLLPSRHKFMICQKHGVEKSAVNGQWMHHGDFEDAFACNKIAWDLQWIHELLHTLSSIQLTQEENTNTDFKRSIWMSKCGKNILPFLQMKVTEILGAKKQSQNETPRKMNSVLLVQTC